MNDVCTYCLLCYGHRHFLVRRSISAFLYTDTVVMDIFIFIYGLLRFWVLIPRILLNAFSNSLHEYVYSKLLRLRGVVACGVACGCAASVSLAKGHV